MRGSAPQTPEYRTNLNALPLIGSIRWFGSLVTRCISVRVEPDNTGDNSLSDSTSTLHKIAPDALPNPLTMNLHPQIM